ncbi:MAG: SMC-Scp complex subunit ScpB [Clostridia bacterium]|nr:SMC-Scp complex subunit ScpB [Clostridia bacterium]
MTELTELECTLEAVLFAAGDSVSEGKLCAVLQIDKGTLEAAAQELADYYDFNRRGIRLLHLDDRYQLASRGDYASAVRGVLETRKPQNLTPSALEVLAIVAYKQPVTKTYIEQVRGVDSTYTVNSLAEKGLIEDCGRLDVPGRPILYRTTESFLRSFGLSSVSQLPSLDSFGDEDNQQLMISELEEAVPPQEEETEQADVLKESED